MASVIRQHVQDTVGKAFRRRGQAGALAHNAGAGSYALRFIVLWASMVPVSLRLRCHEKASSRT